MKKEDVQFHRVGYGGDYLPAVNVKVNMPFWDQEWRKVFATAECGDMPVEWFIEYLEDEDRGDTFQFACESEWEYFVEWMQSEDGPWADTPYRVKVEPEGRQSGWAVVDGLPDVSEWDAIMLGRWAKFARIARAVADGVPDVMVSIVAINAWEWHKEQQHNAMVAQANKVFGLRLPNYNGQVAS